MTDAELKSYLKPKSHWGAIVTTVILVIGAVWASTEYLHSRASADEAKTLQSDLFKVRLDQAIMQGDMKAMHIEMSEGFKGLNGKVDSLDGRRGHGR